jgi:hypothetical protein
MIYADVPLHQQLRTYSREESEAINRAYFSMDSSNITIMVSECCTSCESLVSPVVVFPDNATTSQVSLYSDRLIQNII